MYREADVADASHPLAASATAALDPAPAVAAILARQDAELDYLEAKLAFDAIVDPALDTEPAAVRSGPRPTLS